jgi:5-formyltetrahydrofolate cyclo-ligase
MVVAGTRVAAPRVGGMTVDEHNDLRDAKRRARAERIASRDALNEAAVVARAEALADRIVEETQTRRAATVCLYVSVGNEPGTRGALDRLRESGVRVLLPVLAPGLELDWAEYVPGELAEGRRGLLEPSGTRLGLEAIAGADVVFCPGLAGTPDGRRLGQGGACYDKALPRARPQAPRLLVLYDEDVVADLPADDRDQRVDAILTPTSAQETFARLS